MVAIMCESYIATCMHTCMLQKLTACEELKFPHNIAVILKPLTVMNNDNKPHPCIKFSKHPDGALHSHLERPHCDKQNKFI